LMSPCPHCRAPLPPNAAGCPRCGWRMAMRPGPFPPPPRARPAPSRGAPVLLIVVLVGGFLLLLAAGGVVGVLAYTLRSESKPTLVESEVPFQPGDQIVRIEPLEPIGPHEFQDPLWPEGIVVDPASPPNMPPPPGPPPGMINARDMQFQHHDRNGDGQLTAEDFPRGRIVLFDHMKRMHDKDGNGTITREEFREFAMRR
ncbi:MAG: hypothetical protein ACREIV_03380, partial [Planctomycetaceae bacterium]